MAPGYPERGNSKKLGQTAKAYAGFNPTRVKYKIKPFCCLHKISLLYEFSGLAEPLVSLIEYQVKLDYVGFCLFVSLFKIKVLNFRKIM
jgi:hypothetical protein